MFTCTRSEKTSEKNWWDNPGKSASFRLSDPEALRAGGRIVRCLVNPFKKFTRLNKIWVSSLKTSCHDVIWNTFHVLLHPYYQGKPHSRSISEAFCLLSNPPAPSDDAQIFAWGLEWSQYKTYHLFRFSKRMYRTFHLKQFNRVNHRKCFAFSSKAFPESKFSFKPSFQKKTCPVKSDLNKAHKINCNIALAMIIPHSSYLI